jgi:hypothetical protein
VPGEAAQAIALINKRTDIEGIEDQTTKDSSEWAMRCTRSRTCSSASRAIRISPRESFLRALARFAVEVLDNFHCQSQNPRGDSI